MRKTDDEKRPYYKKTDIEKRPYYKKIDQQLARMRALIDQMGKFFACAKKNLIFHVDLCKLQGEIEDKISTRRKSDEGVLFTDPKVGEVLEEFKNKFLTPLTRPEQDSALIASLEFYRKLEQDVPQYFKLEDALKTVTREQIVHVNLLKAYLEHLRRQIDTENKHRDAARSAHQTLREFLAEHTLPGFEPYAPDLQADIVRTEKHIQKIYDELDQQAQLIFQKMEQALSADKIKEHFEELQFLIAFIEQDTRDAHKFRNELGQARVQLRSALKEAKARRKAEQEAEAKAKEEPPKSSLEKIRDAINLAIQRGQNVVLKGQYRTLGLTLPTMKALMDDQYAEDSMEHIDKVLRTPLDEDVIIRGANRWKQFASDGHLYELTVCPKSGHSQAMPRFYFQKRFFVLTDSANPRMVPSNGNAPADGNACVVWVGVRKGTKRSQKRDAALADAVLFPGDMKTSALQSYNTLSWMMADVEPPVGGKPSPTPIPQHTR